ncbi:hypothetical protein DO97_18785 [Neosynechococcus sphagnicola sy1]|uniref:Uncharacterized protein n=1 Tax=Neosynechococcus sphagnicola sy1 TaxID=1497020 RepID=A0A098TMN1_9CYAN|nr:hypothetical protein [Neosynechococcus sphagnicola]KGF73541.1 hypothetical protein DO97_18785 [Neosynechococcus sphagnicola sy1]
MKQEVVQDFLNLTGILGVALMDGRARPYFCGIDQTLNFQQKEALVQGILQVIGTTPEGFDSFEFQFVGHQVYIYKLSHGIILLVLTDNNLAASHYQQAIADLRVALEADLGNAIATFRLLAGSLTLSGQSYWQQKDSQSPDRASDPIAPSKTPTLPPQSRANHPTPRQLAGISGGPESTQSICHSIFGHSGNCQLLEIQSTRRGVAPAISGGTFCPNYPHQFSHGIGKAVECPTAAVDTGMDHSIYPALFPGCSQLSGGDPGQSIRGNSKVHLTRLIFAGDFHG